MEAMKRLRYPRSERLKGHSWRACVVVGDEYGIWREFHTLEFPTELCLLKHYAFRESWLGGMVEIGFG